MVRSLSSVDIAEHFGVHPNTVRGWRRRGCPADAHEDGAYTVKLDEVTGWHERTKRGDGIGGKRPGAGRPPKGLRAPAPKADESGGDANPAPARPRTGVDGYRDASASVSGLRPEMSEVMSRSEIDRLKAHEQYLAMRRDRLERVGVLVEASRVAQVYGDRVSQATRQLNDMARSLANHLVTDFGLDPARATDVRALIDRHVQGVTREFRGVFSSQEGK